MDRIWSHNPTSLSNFLVSSWPGPNAMQLLRLCYSCKHTPRLVGVPLDFVNQTHILMGAGHLWVFAAIQGYKHLFGFLVDLRSTFIVSHLLQPIS